MDFLALRDVQNEGAALFHQLFNVRNVMELATAASSMSRPSLVRRDPAAATTSCIDTNASDTCQKPTDSGSSTSLIIGLSVAIPTLAALLAFVYLHRRYKKKLRAEDAADEEKYKSMDFGMDLSFQQSKRKAGPKHLNLPPRQAHMRGLSVEEGVASPYFFPPGGRNSVESLASLGRSIRGDDPYNPGVILGKADDMSIRSLSPRLRRDTNSTAAGSFFDGNANLLGHAQAFPRSAPRVGSLPPSEIASSTRDPEKLGYPNGTSTTTPGNDGLTANANNVPRDSYVVPQGFRKSNNYLGQFIHSRDPSADNKEIKVSSGNEKADSATSTLLGSDESMKISVAEIFPSPELSPPVTGIETRPALGVTAVEHPNDSFHSAQASMHGIDQSNQQPHWQTSNHFSDASQYGDAGFKLTPPSPPRHSDAPRTDEYSMNDRTSHYSQDFHQASHAPHAIPTRTASLAAQVPDAQEPQHDYFADEHLALDNGLDELDFDVNRLSVLMRPLPPDDPQENPEERANRIRSFYKEYFDDSKQGGGQHAAHAQPAPQQEPQQHRGRTNYYEDYDSEYLNNGYSIYDQKQQGFIVGGAPFAQPITRRAMTPPPRAPPRKFRGRASSNAPGSGQSSPRMGSPMSSHFSNLPPRGGSSMSGYQSRGRALKKDLPPPTALVSLKTPALLGDDSALYSAFDLAPPPTFRNRQNGMRPDSPLGTSRPYSPTVRPHTPLASSFHELSPMPSPHLLRKSGTFTALDFAPVPRFRGVDNGSDAGSVRSGGSGISSAQVYAMRQGAHRLSRLPQDLAGSKDDIMASLKPKWNMTY